MTSSSPVARSPFARSILLASLLGAACAGPKAVPKPAPAPPTPTAPQLVLVLVIDQFPAWRFEELLPHLPADGLLRQAVNRGVRHTVSYGYAGTYTASGHAAISTGANPRHSGIWVNESWDTATKDYVAIVDDGKSAVHGSPRFASPTALKATAVADVLKEGSAGRSKVASLSYKDRSAILLGGHRPDAAIWYDTKVPGFTTSSYYSVAPPEWLVAWSKAHPIEAMYTPWNAENAAYYEHLLGADDAPGETDYPGFGRTFPHDVSGTKNPASMVRFTPQASELLMELARETVRALSLGQDDVPDLLYVSVSGPDMVGHMFGPNSWEYIDNLIRVDRALGKFVGELESNMRLAVLITGDHGVAPLPEWSLSRGADAGRVFGHELVAQLDAAVDKVVGPGDWVSGFASPLLVLTPAGQAKRAQVVAIMLERLRSTKGVHRAYDVAELLNPQTPLDTIGLVAAESVGQGVPGDVFIVPNKFWVMDEEVPGGTGTNHGSPWPYDREVPVLFWGPGTRPQAGTEILSQRRVAATITALLGVAPPPQADPTPLPGSPVAPTANQAPGVQE